MPNKCFQPCSFSLLFYYLPNLTLNHLYSGNRLSPNFLYTLLLPALFVLFSNVYNDSAADH